jgi:predicted permease
MLERLRHTPGVEAAAIVDIEPGTESYWHEYVTMRGKDDQKQVVDLNRVSDGFFKTLRIPELSGRDFDEHDNPASPKVAIVNETFARRIAEGANPAGRSFQILENTGEPEAWYKIVGLVKDTKYGSLREEFAPIVFLPESQLEEPNNAPTVFMRSNISLSALTASVKRSISNIDPSLTFSFGVFQTDIREGLLPERLMATSSSLFGFLAVVLATVGLYGVMAYMMTRRRKEMGIRIALGADRAAVLQMVLREAATLLLVGLTVGLVLTLFAARAASSLLFGVPSWDPVSLFAAMAGLGFIGLMASWMPAWRASRVDPMAVLREE